MKAEEQIIIVKMVSTIDNEISRCYIDPVMASYFL